ncbi:DHHC palmitoyltransferase-domain-containing protein [Blyttiomyces helicus]|uniref:Palmitoyltransferase n=1 Tax=Blyttiomyces helicus TaxID=388810 RepID=A0A4P9W957_9FUNG|nr:DHHC palmitoyltransferase-domain-containing protein [Blyttiomyces helicus]|eukprot:RKO89081.1 DHHC palmitoyltransferase-domain-containing protein [Blyttiomyces helicus]
MSQSLPSPHAANRPTPPNSLPSPLLVPFCVTDDHAFAHAAQVEDPRRYNTWMRRNGFQRPFHVFSMITLAAAITTPTLHYLLTLPLLVPHLHPTMYTISALFIAAQLTAMIVTMARDPQDPAVRQARVPRRVDYIKVLGVPVIDDETGECGICGVVVGVGTKHCKPCNKCVSKFDHHCQFLSTCIGAENYTTFMATVVLAAVGGWLMAGVAMNGVVVFFRDRERFEGVVQSRFGSGANSSVYFAFVMVQAIFTVVGSLLACQLAGFHLMISYLGLTTWSYIDAKEAHDYGIGPHPMHLRRSRSRRQSRESGSSHLPMRETAPPHSSITVPVPAHLASASFGPEADYRWRLEDPPSIQKPAEVYRASDDVAVIRVVEEASARSCFREDSGWTHRSEDDPHQPETAS